MKFKELRNYISQIDKVSICMLEDSSYENFLFIKEVPNKYDELFVYGIGMIMSEFYKVKEEVYGLNSQDGELIFLPCIEIVLSKENKIE